MLETEDSRRLEKSAKKAENYQTQVLDLNQNLRTLGEHWEFHDEILYMEPSEIMKLKKKKQHQYAVLYIQRLPIKHKAGMLDVNKFDMRYRVSADLSLTLIEKFPSKKPVTAFTLANSVPSLGDLVSTGRMLTLHMSNRLEGYKASDYRQEIKANAHMLKEKTLLLDKDMIDKNFEIRHIDKLYPYPYQITDSKSIEEAILNKDPNYAYISIIPLKTGATQDLHLVLNAENSQILGHSAPNVLVLSIRNDSNKIHQRHLENYHKLVE